MVRFALLLLVFQLSFVTASQATLLSSCAALVQSMRDRLLGTYQGNPLRHLPIDDAGIYPHDSVPSYDLTTKTFIHEHAIIGIGKNRNLNKLVAEVEAAGGEVRLLNIDSRLPKRPTNHDKELLYRPRRSLGKLENGTIGVTYFRLSKSGKPIIALERNSEADVIAHEVGHLRDWLTIKKEFIEKGFSDLEAGEKAFFYWQSSPLKLAETETNAVKEEFAVNGGVDLMSLFSTRRLIYPEISAINHQREITDRPNKKRKRDMRVCMDRAIQKALNLRSLRLEAIEKHLDDKSLPDEEKKQLLALHKFTDDASTLKKEMGIYTEFLSKLFDKRFPLQ